MVTLLWLIIIGAVVYYLYNKKDNTKTDSERQKSSAPKNVQKEQPPTPANIIYEDADCKLCMDDNHGVLLYKGRRYTFGYERREPFATISSATFYAIIRQGENFDACCRGFYRDSGHTIETITGRKLNLAQFVRLLCTAVKPDRGSDSKIEYYMDDLERQAFELEDYRKFREQQDNKYKYEYYAEQPAPEIITFPYPAKTPSECRFPANSENANFQEYGEVPVTMHESEFDEWWFFCEDLDKPCWSYVGMDKQNRCILQRRYRHGTPDHYTFEKRFFIIKRNIMASAFALALMNDNMERTNYFELIEKLNRLVPPTGNPEKDGPEILLPPQELLDNPSEEEIERTGQEKEKHQLSGKVVYKDNKRKLYFAEDGTTPMLDYNGKTYTLSCHPYEPMLIIQHKGENVAYIHNAFYPDDEYKRLLKGELVLSITGKHHNAERFARLLTTALDTGCDGIGEVENWMMVGLARDIGAENIEYAAYDFKCTKVLYEGVALLLGYFDCTTEIVTRKSSNRKYVYALAFGYPHNGTDMYEYYLISEEEYKEYMQQEERQEWRSHEAAYEWHEKHLADKHVLCNEFSHMKKTYKPFFRLSEIHDIRNTQSTLKNQNNQNNQNTSAPVSIRYTRMSVCAQDDYVNGEYMIKLPPDATVKDLVNYICEYNNDDGYAMLPYTGGGSWWLLTYNGGTLARVCDEPVQVIYADLSPDTLVRNSGITEVNAKRAEKPY